ncbi:hypothetical protein MASR2M18_05520 [Ignavibacteria bacterium]
MFAPSLNSDAVKTTSYKVVLPFYLYASFSFLIATIFLFASSEAFLNHYFHPQILAITHIMALGWATMIIIGAGHQLVPVLIEGKLYSNKLAYASFALAAVGIPLLVHGFYFFDMNMPAKWGGRFVVFAIIAYFINVVASAAESKRKNVHSVFVITATAWLLITALLGLALVYNFTYDLLPQNSFHYFSVHAHIGIIGWFLLLVIGVASRLIPMFLISKYTNVRLLWLIFALINGALLSYIVIFFIFPNTISAFVSVGMVLAAAVLFIFYCHQAYKQRLRRQVDEQVRISLLSAFMLLLPIILLFVIIALSFAASGVKSNLILGYGFVVFFGWLTAVILGMTFKTMPFIVWNTVYRQRSAAGKTPNPKDLFDNLIFKIMGVLYLVGFTLFTFGIMDSQIIFLKSGSVFLISTSVLYNWNVLKVFNHKAVTMP